MRTLGMPKKTAHKEPHRTMPRETAARHDLLLRLRRVEGQVRGIQKMVEAGALLPGCPRADVGYP